MRRVYRPIRATTPLRVLVCPSWGMEEETFGITFENDDVVPENLASISALATFIDRKRSEGG